ncbi:unnamed protein product, partial [Rotaria sp. Silwood2]
MLTYSRIGDDTSALDLQNLAATPAAL